MLQTKLRIVILGCIAGLIHLHSIARAQSSNEGLDGYDYALQRIAYLSSLEPETTQARFAQDVIEAKTLPRGEMMNRLALLIADHAFTGRFEAMEAPLAFYKDRAKTYRMPSHRDMAEVYQIIADNRYEEITNAIASLSNWTEDTSRDVNARAIAFGYKSTLYDVFDMEIMAQSYFNRLKAQFEFETLNLAAQYMVSGTELFLTNDRYYPTDLDTFVERERYLRSLHLPYSLENEIHNIIGWLDAEGRFEDQKTALNMLYESKIGQHFDRIQFYLLCGRANNALELYADSLNCLDTIQEEMAEQNDMLQIRWYELKIYALIGLDETNDAMTELENMKARIGDEASLLNQLIYLKTQAHLHQVLGKDAVLNSESAEQFIDMFMRQENQRIDNMEEQVFRVLLEETQRIQQNEMLEAQARERLNIILALFALLAVLSSLAAAYLFSQRRSILSAKALAIEGSEAKTRFLANMSHEIRTPINGILGMAESLGNSELQPSQSNDLHTLKQCGQHLLNLVDDVLDVSLIENNQLKLREAPFTLLDIERNCLASFQAPAEDKGIKLSVIYGKNTKADALYLADPTRIQQILFNLVSNAIKYTEKGHVRIALAIMEIGATPQLRMRVEDTGIGMSEDMIARAPQRFVQGDDSLKRKHGGMGLGMSIASDLAALFGGRLIIDSELGRGTKIDVVVPVQRVETPSAPSIPQESERATHPSILNLLVAEDHEINRRLIEIFMRDYDVDITFVENGADAVESCKNTQFDIVLLDIQMPIMDGLEALSLIRGLEPYKTLPILAFTAHAMEHQQKVYLEAGFDNIIAKPFNVNSISLALETQGIELILKTTPNTVFEQA